MEVADLLATPDNYVGNVIAFPKDGKGRKASAEGTFEKIAADDSHEAEHAKETMKQSGATEATKYRIRATGAVIY